MRKTAPGGPILGRGVPSHRLGIWLDSPRKVRVPSNSMSRHLKTFLANAFGHLACCQGYSVLFTRADAMLQTLKKSRFDNSREDEMLALITVDLLIIDDFALEPMSRDESKDVYELFVERTGHASTIITSNRDTSEWIAMFDDVLRAQSAVDRFKNAAYDLVIEGESYRPRQKPKLGDGSPSPELSAPRAPMASKRKRSKR